VSSVITVCS